MQRIEKVLVACFLVASLGSARPARAQEWSTEPPREVPWSTAAFSATSPATPEASPHADLICRLPPVHVVEPGDLTVATAGSLATDLAIDGADALARFRDDCDAGRWSEAAVALETARVGSPVLADRFALLRADLEMQTGASDETCARYDVAIESPLPAVSARARLGRVRCLLSIDARSAEEELATLRRRYHDLPEERQLDLEHAAHLARRGDLTAALAIYETLDRTTPGSPEAARARAELAALAEAGQRPRPRTMLVEVDRLERLARSGPPELARAEAERLRVLTGDTHLSSRVSLVLARLARVEGRFADAAALMREARAVDPAVGEDPAQVAEQALDLAEAARGRVESSARDDLRRLGYSTTRTLRNVQTMRLVTMVRIAARAGLREETAALVQEANRRTAIACPARFDIAIFASGTTDDESIVTLLASCAEGSGERAIAARYHRARALERLGRTEEARAELEAITIADSSDTQIYAVLSRGRLEASAPTQARPPSMELTEDGKGDERAAAAAIDVEAALTTLAARHPTDFPWIGRAAALVALGDRQGASDELFQTYSAWAQALGRTPLRAGLESVYRGAASPRIPGTPEQRRDRRSLPDEDRRVLADVADALGDPGLAIRLDSNRASGHPRAFAPFVEAAAARYGLDPNLLFAVMRVESIYNPRIVSYAGAIGLLQIMPRTGRLIAHELGREDFTVDELLDPETNVELAAWYLHSLIERFDGRLPLAIAAYNGGPHNVRRWLADHSPTLPVDALMEHIPFEQTYRYVRRVLSHYAAYRAEAGLPPAQLELDQPALEPDLTAF